MKVIKLSNAAVVAIDLYAMKWAGFADRVEFDFDARELRVVEEPEEAAFVLEVIANERRERPKIGSREALGDIGMARSLEAVARRIKK